MLVPEVSLIPQIADRLRAVVGDELAVLHSGLSAGSATTSGGASCAARRGWWSGTRTAAFAPVDAG